jgi:regulator of sirC expression with transglutaminase-like and TPR domain
MRFLRARSLGSGLFLFLAAAAARGDPGVLDVALEIARKDHRPLDEDGVRGEIDRLAARYREFAAGAATPAARADALRRLLFDDARFTSVEDLETARTLHVDTVLRDRRGYCLSLSVVALAVAERAGLPLFGVALPNHFLVRYDDGAYRENLELTRRGKAVPDAEYREACHGRLREDGVYLRNLTVPELRAFLLHNRGYVALVEKRPADAAADFDAAIAAVPGLGEAHRNRGVLLGEKKDWAAARRAFARALACYPGDVDALLNLALCRNATGDRAAAIQDLEIAREIAPGHARVRELLEAWRAPVADTEAAPAAEAPSPAPPADLVPGLRARFYAGTDFERLVAERVDRTLDFDWKNDRPAERVPADGFSVRWEGWFNAPRDGTYTFFVAANDGCRVRVGRAMVLENWRDMGLENFYGSGEIRLAAGRHSIVVEHFDARGGARLLLRIGVEGERDPLPLAEHLFHAK